MRGAKPKDEKVTRVPPVHDWTDVPDVPYAGDVPSVGRVPVKTKAWWGVVSAMPHCILWKLSDWQFALATAWVHAEFVKGDMARAPELRVREAKMGTTLDARRDLRIRYVKPDALEDAASGEPTDFEAERRRRLMDAE